MTVVYHSYNTVGTYIYVPRYIKWYTRQKIRSLRRIEDMEKDVVDNFQRIAIIIDNTKLWSLYMPLIYIYRSSIVLRKIIVSGIYSDRVPRINHWSTDIRKRRSPSDDLLAIGQYAHCDKGYLSIGHKWKFRT